jgi:uncharacterized protein (UPF0333 family)
LTATAALTFDALTATGQAGVVGVEVYLSDLHSNRITAFTVDGEMTRRFFGRTAAATGELVIDLIPNSAYTQTGTYYTVKSCGFLWLIDKSTAPQTLANAVTVSPAELGVGATLGSLADVDTTGAVDGNALVFNVTLGEWVPGGGGVGGAMTGAEILTALAPVDGTGSGLDADTVDGTHLAALLTTVAAATTYQPLDGDLTAIAALATTTYGRAFLALVDAAAGRTALGLGSSAVLDSTAFDAAGAAAAAQAASQPLDSDLTAIAALTTTPFGRAFLALVDAAAGRTALGLGGAATLAVGAATGTVAAGDDTRFTDSRAPSGAASGDLTGTFPSPTVAKVNGVAVTGTPSVGQVPVATGVAAATWQTPAGGAPSGAAGGDLTGTYPNPTVAAAAVTLAKMENRTSKRLIGRTTAGSGVPESLTMATVMGDLSGQAAADFSLNTHKITALSRGTVDTDAVNVGQVGRVIFSDPLKTLPSLAAQTSILSVAAPSLPASAVGDVFHIIAAGAVLNSVNASTYLMRVEFGGDTSLLLTLPSQIANANQHSWMLDVYARVASSSVLEVGGLFTMGAASSNVWVAITAANSFNLGGIGVACTTNTPFTFDLKVSAGNNAATTVWYGGMLAIERLPV